MASERERLSTIKIVVFYIIVSVTFLFGQAVPTKSCSNYQTYISLPQVENDNVYETILKFETLKKCDSLVVAGTIN